MRRFALTVLLLAAAVAAAGEAALPPLVVIDHDVLVLRNNDRIPGTLIKRNEDGSVVFRSLGKTGSILYGAIEVADIEPSQTAVQVVERRGRLQLERKDALGLRRTIDWGRKNQAAESALALAQQTLALFPTDTEIAGLVLAMLAELDRQAEIGPAAAAILAANPIYEPAFVALVGALQAEPGREAEILRLTEAFLEQRPTSQPANALKARLIEVRDPRAARSAHEKGWLLHKDADAGLGYARTSLRCGEWKTALATAEALLAANAHTEAAHAVAGIAQLAQGDAAAARANLEQAMAGIDRLDPDLALWTRYDHGLALWRAGERGAARQQWSKLDHPVARLAFAILDGKGVDEAQFPEGSAVRAVAREHNACIALTGLKAERALASIDPKASERQRFLAEVAQVLRSSGSVASIRALAATDSDESRRWQAYGHLIARRWDDAEAVLTRLPEDDGWAAVYRVYVAAGRKDPARAKELFRQVALSRDPPQQYVALLAAEYAAENDELLREEFDWPDGDALGSGWQQLAPETNIRVHAAGGHLIFAGRQTVSRDPVTRAWRMVPAERLRAVEARFDIGGIASAQTGLELLDAQRQNGVALGILADNVVGWRGLRGGEWTQWTRLPLRVEGTQPVLRLEIAGGRIQAIRPDRPAERFALGDARLPPTGVVAVTLFGVAEAGTDWKVGVDSLQIQLMPSNR